MSNWKDTTSYKCGGNQHQPTNWAYDAGDFVIHVWTGHSLYPEQWVMFCYELKIDTCPLGLKSDVPAEQAQEKAVEMIRSRLMKMLNLLPEKIEPWPTT